MIENLVRLLSADDAVSLLMTLGYRQMTESGEERAFVRVYPDASSQVKGTARANASQAIRLQSPSHAAFAIGWHIDAAVGPDDADDSRRQRVEAKVLGHIVTMRPDLATLAARWDELEAKADAIMRPRAAALKEIEDVLSAAIATKEARWHLVPCPNSREVDDLDARILVASTAATTARDAHADWMYEQPEIRDLTRAATGFSARYYPNDGGLNVDVPA